MDLWIKSQDGEGLFKVDKLWHSYDKNENEHCINDYESTFGVYKSKERALEVLDEFNEFKDNVEKAMLYSNMPIEEFTTTYEMPKE